VVPTPDIKTFKIKDSHDFILIGCDGIFEKMTNEQLITVALKQATKFGQN
jgi:protein phosphatase PTC2/3